MTTTLYLTIMFTPPDTLATLTMPEKLSPHMTEEMYANMLENIIEEYHLDNPFPAQCLR